MSDKGHNCGNCRFFRDEQGTPTCRRRSPLGHAFIIPVPNALTGQQQLQPQTIGYFPIVRQTNWCGDWEQAVSGELDS